MKNPAFSSLRLRLAAVALSGSGLVLAAPPVARAQDTAVYTTLHNFAGTDGSFPAELVVGSDGNFYGTTKTGGFGYVGNSSTGYGTVFQTTPTGELTTLYVFAGADDGQNPFDLIKGLDGNFYGLTGSGGPNGGGTLFRISPMGELTTLYAATSRLDVVGLLAQDDSGNFYGVSDDADEDSGSIFRLTPAGVYTTLYKFLDGDDGVAGSSLTRGSDGNFYGTSGFGADGRGTIYQITPAGGFKTLYTFTGGTDGADPTGLTLGPDGNLYGTTLGGGTDSYGVVFRITNAGQFSVLYSFTGGSDSGFPINDLVLGSDGDFYGITEGDTRFGGSASPAIRESTMLSSTLPSVFFRVTPQGVLTPLYASATAIGGSLPNSNGFVQGSDGSFYSTDSGEGSGEGSVYKLTVVSHPAFFTGQAPLVDGVDYLAFPNGNVFGYYTFLSDPDYLYHFDLGYEYIFDAKDGLGGVYLYDFASNDFFYTSPIFPFPYLYDFNLKSVLYYYPDMANAGHYNTDGVRYFYDFGTGTVISK